MTLLLGALAWLALSVLVAGGFAAVCAGARLQEQRVTARRPVAPVGQLVPVPRPAPERSRVFTSA